LPALVRGMFVDCSIQTKPSRALILLPKLALKPGNQVWQFAMNPSLVADESEKTESKAADSKPIETNSGTKMPGPPKLNLSDWSAGNIRILKDVKVISTIRSPQDRQQEFWIAEARADLQPGTLAVVTPLANLVGDGTDKVRHQLDKKTGTESKGHKE
jgi:hypothetical protein